MEARIDPRQRVGARPTEDVQFFMLEEMPQPTRTAVIITALGLEANAVCEHLIDITEEAHEKGTIYSVGRFDDNGQCWRVAIVISGQGNPTAAAEVERAIQHFSPSVILLVGVAGALKDLKIGDVVAAEKVHGYERGKDERDFRPRPDSWRPTYPALQRAKTEARGKDWHRRIKGERPRAFPKAIVAPIAAGEKVVAARESSTFQLLRAAFSDAVAVEMEGAGFLTAAYLNTGVDALVVRGISDLVEGKTNADAGGSQPLAARHAAAFAFQFLSKFRFDSDKRSSNPLHDRAAEIHRRLRESRARCIERWQGAGLSLVAAQDLADDNSVGEHGLPLREGSDGHGGLTVLIGEFGLGKSLVCERLYQKALYRSLADSTAPVPVYFELFPGRVPTTVDLKALSAGVGDIETVGTALFLERSDEGDQRHSLDCLGLARRVIATWPASTVVMPSRPLPLFIGLPESVQLPLMEPGDAAALVHRVSGLPFSENDLYTWRGSLTDALRRPLFAILFGLYLRTERAKRHFPTPGELMDALVSQALRRGRIDGAGATTLLERLGVETVDQAGHYVHYSTVGGLLEADALSKTGLIARRGDLIGFALPIVAQWFAAQAVTRSSVDLPTITADKQRSGAWRYPFSIVAASSNRGKVDELMRLLTSDDPALAAVVLEDAVRQTFTVAGQADAADTFAPEERLQVAWRSWASGLGEMTPAAGPPGSPGTPDSIRTRVEGNEMIVEWFDGPVDARPRSRLLHTLHMSNESRPDAWYWQTPLEHMRRELAECLRHFSLPIEQHEPLAVEAIWAGSLALTGRNAFRTESLPVVEIERALNASGGVLGWVHCRDRGNVPLALIAREVDRLKASGASEMTPPHPGADIAEPPDSYVWCFYSEERLLNRTRSVYELAIEGYQYLVRRWFARFRPRLTHAIVLPARFIATLRPAYGGKERSMHPPGLYYRFEPLPVTDRSSVHIEIDPRPPEVTRDLLIERWASVQNLRTAQTQWISSVSGSTGLEVSGTCPATRIAFDWLTNDLRHVHWS
jgi:nucleoside phosphorylase